MRDDFEDIFDFMARDPFPWQVEQAETFHNKISKGNGRGNFTLVAAPNSGKTDAAAMNMLIARSKFGIRQFFFLSPTSVIKDQVIEDFSHLGLFFSSGYNNRKLIRSRLDPVEHAQIRMFMSGTPFRSDGAEIPFVTYKEE